MNPRRADFFFGTSATATKAFWRAPSSMADVQAHAAARTWADGSWSMTVPRLGEYGLGCRLEGDGSSVAQCAWSDLGACRASAARQCTAAARARAAGSRSDPPAPPPRSPSLASLSENSESLAPREPPRLCGGT